MVHMNLIKTSLLNGIAVVVKMITLLGINKILAVYVGPSGYAALGQFQNIIQMINTFASGAINTGVTKYTAEFYENPEAQYKIWRAASALAVIGSSITALGLVLFHEPLARWFFNDLSHSNIFLWLAASLIFMVLNSLLLAIMNGKKEIKRLVVANISGSFLALVITSIMVVWNGLYGALVSLAIYQSFAFFSTFFICSRREWFRWRYFFGEIDSKAIIKLSKYSAMALTSAACIPASHILIRNNLTEVLGVTAAGYWEAMWRLSSAYLMLVTTTLSVYYLPRLSELKSVKDIKKEVIGGYRILLPLVILSAIVIYFLRDVIIFFLFTPEFYPIRELFGFQLLGDTLRIGSWIIAYLMLSKAMFKTFMITEIAFSISLVLLVKYMIDGLGTLGAVMAYAVNYLLYWIIVYVLVFRRLNKLECM